MTTAEFYWPDNGEKVRAELEQALSPCEQTRLDGERNLVLLRRTVDRLDELRDHAAQLAARLRTGTHQRAEMQTHAAGRIATDPTGAFGH